MNDNTPHDSDSPPAAGFDAQRAAQLRAQAVDSFRARARRVERYLCIWLVFCLLIACVATRNFFESTETQAMVLWAVLFLVMIETTILMKLWYWIISTRLGTQRELRLLRFDLAAGSEAMRDLDDLSQVESPSRPVGLSKWERRAWTAVLLFLGVAIGSGGDFRVLFRHGGPVFQNVIHLEADGTGKEVTHWTYVNKSHRVLREVPLYNGGSIARTEFVPASDSPYRDAKGRTLAVRREPAGENHRDVIQLLDPVPAFGKVDINWTTAAQAARQDDIWFYQLGPGNSYDTTVVLPPGAELVSVDPAETSRSMEGDRMSLRFRVSTPPDRLVAHRIRFRPPQPASAP